MAQQTCQTSVPPDVPGGARVRPLRRPSVPDLVFLVVLVMGLVSGRSGFLNDPGTYWHIQLGREITQTGSVPRADHFTYTRDRTPWVDQSWAFDLVLAAIYDRWAWSGAVAATALTLAWIYWALARGLCRSGITPLVAFSVGVVSAGIGSIHFLTRPHILTFGFVLWTLQACQAFHERSSRVIWAVPLAVALWANVHGGFLAGPLIVATAAVGHAVSGAWTAERRRQVGIYLAVLLLSTLAPLANPYGWGLYRHVFGLLFASGVTRLINEYQPSPFGHMDVMVLEWAILALVAVPAFARNQLDRYQAVPIVVWLHLALGSVRHVPLFAIAAAPGLAQVVDGLVAPVDPRTCKAAGHWTPWPVVASLVVILAVFLGAPLGHLDPTRWPTQALPVLNRQPVSARLFHEQDWGGMIEAECHPCRRTFLDDRFELYDKPTIVEYMEALHGGPAWDALDGRQHFDLVWIRTECGLAKRLAGDPNWDVLFQDRVSILLRRRDVTRGL